MGAMTQLWRVSCLTAVVVMAALAFGQDAPETPAPAGQASAAAVTNTSSDDAELVAEVQRLRSDVDRLKRQLTFLNSVVEQLQSERAPVERAAAKPPAKAAKKKAVLADDADAAPTVVPDIEEKVTKTLLVFRDGHKTEATNYAIVGQTLWIYTEQDSKKVPLSDLDVAATKTANSDRGVTFQVPPSK
jgi:hypothetical protein